MPNLYLDADLEPAWLRDAEADAAPCPVCQGNPCLCGVDLAPIWLAPRSASGPVFTASPRGFEMTIRYDGGWTWTCEGLDLYVGTAESVTDAAERCLAAAAEECDAVRAGLSVIAAGYGEGR
jgi:hypothetical protein